MTEPPRPPGDGYPGVPPDPNSPPPPTSGGGAYPPPSSGGGAYAPPPTSGGGYAPPPAGGYPPPGGGYPPAGGGYPQQGAYYGGAGPAGYANNDEKTWALVAHFGGALGAFIGGGAGGWIAPLVALIVKGNESPTTRAHAVQALNFQILWSIIAIIGYITICIFIGIFIAIAAWLIATIFGVIAGVKANNGELYNYPMSIKMVK
jgi:uncharacterized Tic20 family protein